MGSTVRGFAIVIVLAIIVIFFWCFIFGKCRGKGFGIIPPRPNVSGSGSGSGRRKQDKLDASGSGSGNAGVGGSEGGSASLKPQFERARETYSEMQSKGCGFWDIACKLGKFFTTGETIFGQKPPSWIPEPLRVPIKGRSAIIVA